MQYFTSQLRSEQDTTQSLRASQYRKKRHPASTDSEDDSSLSPAPDVKTPPGTRAQSYASFASPELAQLRVAGLLLDERDQVPPAPFPHAHAKTSSNRYGSAKVQEDMATEPSRLYAVRATSKRDHVDSRPDSNSLKRTHLNVLSTIMHRCLLQGDYERAGKAWGMILRTQVAGGHFVDPRNHGRWGIGAEILLRRNPQSATSAPTEHVLEPPNHEPSTFSEGGFELAREYYERLIVQHPNRKTHVHAIDERIFYPAMFSLWIYEVCEKSERARRKIHVERQISPSSTTTSTGVDEDALTAQEDAIQLEELARAMEIAERIDRLIVSPPFDKQASLLQLRANVNLWISELIIGKLDLDEDWDMDTSFDSEESSRPVSDQLVRLTNGKRELLQAQVHVNRAETNGTRQGAALISSIDIRLKQVDQQIAKLQVSHEHIY